LKDYCGTGDSSSSRSLQPPRADSNVKVLTYNLWWWNLFKQRKGNNGEAGKNIAAFAKDAPFDLMGFQECEDVSWPLRDAKSAGMSDEYTTIVGRYATAIAYRTSAFTQLETGQVDVAEDVPGKFHFGKRVAQWVRLTQGQRQASFLHQSSWTHFSKHRRLVWQQGNSIQPAQGHRLER